jgi:hypothetical protein
VQADGDTNRHAGSRPPQPSLMAPPQPRNLTRVETTWRPFLGFVRQQLGGDRRGAHQSTTSRRRSWWAPSWSPVAIASGGDGLGAATHARVIGAFVTDHLSLA